VPINVLSVTLVVPLNDLLGDSIIPDSIMAINSSAAIFIFSRCSHKWKNRCRIFSKSGLPISP